MRIRTRLLILILAILVPAFLAAALAVGYVYVEERHAQENSVKETVRAFALLVENELENTEGILHTLARSPALAEGDMEEFHRHARAMAPLRDGAIVLHAASGARLLDTRVPFGSALPARRLANIDTLARRDGADRTLVSDLFTGPDGIHRFVVQVPVRLDGRVAYYLSMSVNAAKLQALLERQRFPERWQAVIADRQGRVVARLREAEKFRGHLVGDQALRSFAAQQEGTVSANNLAGIPMHGFFSTVPDYGWRAMVTIPQDEMRRVPLYTASFLGAIMTLLLVLAVAGARWFGQRAAAPIEYLGRGAEELGAGREVAYTPQGVLEIDAVARRMAEASRQILRAQAEMERRVAEAVANSERAQSALLQGQKLEALGRLTGGIAHEFNNLLQTLTTALQIAALTSNQPKVQTLIDTCKRTVGRATALTTRLGSFGRLQDARLATVDPGEQIRGSVQLLRGVLRQGGGLEIDCADGLWPVTVDPLQFDLALLNLTINARDAMPGGGRLVIAARNETLEPTTTRPGGDYVRVSVTDTGSGMPPEVLAHALDPFFTTKAPGEGTGLGLPQAYAFATQSQGWLALTSAVGAGTTVDVYLPRSRQPLTPQQAARQGTALPRGAGRVLFVEDDPLVREAVVRGLEDAGFDVVVAASGDAALAMLDGGLDTDVVFSDIVMPGQVSGIDLAALLRERRPGLPVVLATGYTDQRAALPGVQVLSKPYEIEQLVALLGGLATKE
ncbi:response regulator [uncultured Massilia sp.]|uniref:hybrid sensor histidine kinase/response regulator n=1 Tax=uncultured Massilia sp. TaxID=169973 RepID=UPI0025E790A5|nr:response regulator [uncultured Massilia sp.]